MEDECNTILHSDQHRGIVLLVIATGCDGDILSWFSQADGKEYCPLLNELPLSDVSVLSVLLNLGASKAAPS